MTLDLGFSMQIPHSYLEGLRHCSFPNLRVLNLDMELTPSVLAFMRRNNLRIRELFVSSGEDSQPSAPLCTFPKLECYGGSFELMPAFLPGSLVQQITTNFFATDNVESSLCALSKITVPLKTISILSDSWDMRFFESLSRHAPRVLGIEFESDSDADMMVVRTYCRCRNEAAHIIYQAFMANFTSVLAQFTCIQNLDLVSYMQSEDRDVISSQFHDDYEVLKSWRQICPSLKTCRLPASK
jgi:hypothetical protein